MGEVVWHRTFERRQHRVERDVGARRGVVDVDFGHEFGHSQDRVVGIGSPQPREDLSACVAHGHEA